ncbi:DUF1269 domain-containing protein [Microbacterium bovistercoris]|uniref:DUF1269 domain-containing protein n=1 Tax=Microbacterium bovistercoris TaxID=2293570 RepID=A0A371NPB9_9MICO|nr:DUF1269 domain-containing protein [Microbacterium bovistercoris]REJ04041.1 DUF1269 domain-containing protein [Microbacterium bovistercoris]
MTTFTAWKFETVEGAETATGILREAADEGLIKIEDYAVIEWTPGEDRPKVKYEHRDDWRATGWGALLGGLAGVLFFLPLIGAAAGAAIGLLVKKMDDAGISKEQLDRIGKEVVPGTSALFVVNTETDRDRLAERFHGVGATLIASNLVSVDEDTVRKAFEG